MLFDDVLEIMRALGRLLETVADKGITVGSISAIGTLLYAIFKVRGIKRRLKRYAPYLFADDPVPDTYIANQQLIMENQRRLMAALGVETVCPPDPKNAVILTATRTPLARIRAASRTSFWGAFFCVRSAVHLAISWFTNSNTRRLLKMNMKKWFRPDSLTIILGIITAAFTRYFGIEIDPANILAAAVLLIGYFKAHELVTVVRDANGLPSGFRLNSRKLIFTVVAFLAVVLDEAFQLKLPTDLLLTVAAAVTGFNYLESTKDAKAAEAEGAAARQTY